MSHTCVGSAWSAGAFRSRQCGKSAAYEHEGQWYCKTHHPPTVAAKAEARQEERDRKWRYEKSLRDKAAAKRAEMERRAALFPELLEALRWIERRCPAEFLKQEPHVIHTEAAHDAGACARAAIAKAEGK
jgi:hypothetical protein